jgi:hypothetical protein
MAAAGHPFKIMFDFWRNLTKSAEEKRQEALHAYLDNALPPRQRRQFEAQLAADSALQTELAQMQRLKQNLRRLPRHPAPRNFTLNPALYGRPQRQPLVQAYPALRLATVLTAFFFILALAAGLSTAGQNQPAAAPQVALEFSATEAPPMELRQGESAEAPMAGAAEEEAAGVMSTDEGAADSAVPQGTLTAELAAEALPTATSSALPRQPTEEALAANRLATSEATVPEMDAAATAAAPVTQTPTSRPWRALQLAQLLLGLALGVLILLTLLARRARWRL